MNQRDSRTNDLRRRGVVLVLVLVVVALLTLACLTFSELMLTERKAAHVAARQAQARATAESGVEWIRQFLALDQQTQEDSGGLYDNEQQFRGVIVGGDEENSDAGRFTIVAPYVVDQDTNETGIRFGLENESTRLNLNILCQLDEQMDDAGRDLLMGLPGMTEDIADAILDWIDEDEEQREYGAEADYYSALVPGYAPKNGPLETVEELLLVRGVTPWLLFGCDANRNGFIDGNEPETPSVADVDNSDGSMNRGWAAMLTLYSMEMNVNPDGEQRINLNQDDMQTLFDELEEAFSSEWATFIVAYRLFGPYSGTKVPEKITGDEELDLSQKPKAPLSTVLDLIGSNVEAEFEGGKKVVETPFPDMPGLMGTFLPVLMDSAAASDSPMLPGRVNINQASRTLLEGIPGLEADAVEAIVSQREPNPLDAPVGQRHETWILADGIVTLEQMKVLMPFVTGGGSVYRAQVIGYFDRGGPAVRIETILDATTQPAKIRLFRDISHLGRGYPLETLGVEAPEW